MYDKGQFLKADGCIDFEGFEDDFELDEDTNFVGSKSDSGRRPPSYCPYPGMCSNYEDDRDMCEECGGF